VVKEASAQRFPWAKAEWGRYRQRAVIYADPDGAGQFTIWAWDLVPEVSSAALKNQKGSGCLAVVFTQQVPDWVAGTYLPLLHLYSTCYMKHSRLTDGAQYNTCTVIGTPCNTQPATHSGAAHTRRV
jgi:hypothetical protein